MIEIPRSLARQLRAVFRRGLWAGTAPRARPFIVFQGGPDGLLVHSQQGGLAVAYRLAGTFAAESLALAGGVLQEVEGKGTGPVRLETTAPGRCLARWEEGGVPRAQEYDAADPLALPPLPDTPPAFTPPGPGFLAALEEAMQTAPAEAVRRGLPRVQLRATGTVVATDGRQLLLHRGFRFPWAEDLLVPKTGACGGPELRQQEDVGVARTDGHVVVRAGPWRLYLPVDTQSHFPRAEDVFPRATANSTRWQLSAPDAAFLLRALPGLPGEEGDYSPVTLDLGPVVAVRARAAGQERGTELVLVGSAVTGPAVQFATNRRYLARALALGFTEFEVVSADAPVQCRAGDRHYLWMPLGKAGALAPSEQDIRVSSAGPVPTTPDPPTERRIPAVTTPTTNGHAVEPASAIPVGDRAEGSGADGLVREAQALQGALRDALAQTGRLVQALKQQRRQGRLMRATLASLKQLQQVGG